MQASKSRTDSKHPRLRGEDELITIRGLQSVETPPLTRGRLQKVDAEHLGPRNTPAYAGKTYAARAAQLEEKKHPRLRGEDASI